MIDSQEVDRVIELAQLTLGPDERARLAGELATILDYVARLQEVEILTDPADGGAPAGRGLAATPLRDDVVAPPLSRDAALANAPSTEAGLFRLPRLLD